MEQAVSLWLGRAEIQRNVGGGAAGPGKPWFLVPVWQTMRL
jgi:hypothetical protein